MISTATKFLLTAMCLCAFISGSEATQGMKDHKWEFPIGSLIQRRLILQQCLIIKDGLMEINVFIE